VKINKSITACGLVTNLVFIVDAEYNVDILYRCVFG